jgi:outer membrane autotransporter protein
VPGFSGIGSAIDNFGLNPTSIAILTALSNVSDPGLPNALAELSPKDLEIFRNVAFDNNTFYVAQINNHLANLRDGMTGFDSSALSVNSDGVDPGLAPINDHLKTYSAASRPGLTNGLVDPKDMKEMQDPKSLQTASEPADRWSTFISGNVILADLDNSLPYQNADYTTGAVTAGADYRLDENFTVGALFSYAHTAADLDYHGSQATVDSYAPGIYASYVNGGWYANGLATYVRNSYTEDREIDIPGIVGDNHGATSGNQGTGNLTGGYEFQSGAFKFGPVATVEYVHLDIDSIQEQGPTALSIADQSDDSLRTLVGFEGRYATAVALGSDRWVLTPHFSASWQHEYLDNSNGITAQFSPAGGGSFATPLDNPERDSAFIDAGLDAEVNSTTTIFVDYQVQAGQDDFFAQSVQGGVRIKF